jgi:hypothetical protein
LSNLQEVIRKENNYLYTQLAFLQDKEARLSRMNQQLGDQISGLLDKNIIKN